MKKRLLSFIFVFAAVLLITCPSSTILAEADTTTISYDVTYCQTEARSMLAMINAFRIGDEAWYWNEDDSAKVTDLGLSELTYDYALEEIAMQRAAEIAISFSHTRPNRSSWSSLSSTIVSITSSAENIAAGQTSAAAAFASWQETEEAYSGQGHRRNMLGNYSSIGIACVYLNGYYYWVQEFGTSNSGASSTTANDSTTTVSTSVDSNDVSSATLTADPTAYSLEVGGATAAVPTVKASVSLSGTWPSGNSVSATVSPTWTVDDSNLLTISDGMITAKAPGTATLTASALGESVSATATITAPITSCTVSLDASDCTYDGTAKKPTVSVSYGDRSLTAGTDYNLSYSDNVNAGTATVTITGTGYYTGSVDQTFTISPKSLTESMVELDTSASYTYDGAAKEASITVTDAAIVTDTTTLTNGTDYTLSYSNNINAGTATVTISGVGNYTGSVEQSFTIDPAAISDAAVAVASGDYVYNGTAQKPSVTVMTDSASLTEGTDYTVTSYDNNVNAGTATVTVTGTGNYTGSTSGEFTIERKTLTAAISGTTTKTYDGTTAVNTDLTLTLTDIVDGDDVSAAAEGYAYNSAEVKEATTITATGITLSGSAVDNYQLSSTTATAAASISKADYEAGEYEQKVIANQAVSDVSVDLSADVLAGGACGTPSLNTDGGELVDSSSLSVSEGVLSFATTAQAAQTTAVISVPVSSCDNYNDYTIPVTVIAAEVRLSADGTITGYTGVAIDNTEITLTIGNATLADSLTGSWITNLPDGLSQSVARTNDTTVTITVGGTAGEVISGSLEWTIPAGNLTDIGGSIKVTGGSIDIEEATYELSLTENAGEFAELTYGYASGSSVTYIFTNTGNQKVTGISAETSAGFTASLSGTEAATGENITVTVTSDTGLSAGEITGNLMLTWNNMEEIWTGSLSQTVNKAENALEISGDLSKIYDGASASVTVSAAYGSESAAVTWEDAEGTVLAAAPTAVGNYKVTVSIAESENYKAASIAADYQITLAAPIVSLEDKTVTYTGVAVSIGEAVVTLVNNETYDGAVVYTYYSDADCTEPLNADTLPVEAGTYYVVASVEASGNYSGAASEAAAIVITAAAQSLAYETTEVTKTEGDAAFTNALTLTTVYGTITYTSSDSSVASVDENGQVTVVGAGTATITASVSGSDSYTAATASYTLTVSAETEAPVEEETKTESETNAATEAETETESEATYDFEYNDLMYRLVVVRSVESVSDDLVSAGMDSVETLKSALLQIMVSQVSEASEETIAYYDVELLVQLDGEWVVADEEHFPEEGITVTLAYPSGTGKTGYSFTVVHMFSKNALGKTAGEYEFPELTLTDDGIQMTLTGLSPVAVSWTADEIETESENETEARTETETEAVTEAQAETETEAATETQAETETEAATEAQTETETEAATEAQTETETEAETEAQTDKETETLKETETA
ncbi:MAG: CAP domain-containing protein, partial [Clostridiales bacterium]|nr:CAP domain-containing protein [Clostridiales bacterium]